MDEDRSKALLEWVNSCTDDNKPVAINSLTDLSYKHRICLLLNILILIDPDSSSEAPPASSEPKQIFRYVASYLEGFYRQKLDNIVSVCNAASGDELEITKFVTLLLCSAVQCNHVQLFVERITKMTSDVQFHIKSLIELVLQQMENGGLTSTFGELLVQRAPTKELLGIDGNSSMCSPGTVLVIQSPVETLFTNSPLKSLLASPQLKSRQTQFMMNKLNQKVNKLQMAVETLENEVAEKNKELHAKDSKILEQSKLYRDIKVEMENLEGLQRWKPDCEKAEQENARLKLKLKKLKAFQEQCHHMQERMVEHLEERKQLEHQLKETEQLRASCDHYRNHVTKLEFRSSELTASLRRLEARVLELQNQKDEVQRSFQQATELWEERKNRDEKAEEEEAMGENIGLVIQDGRIIELEFENTRLREQLAAAPDQQEMQALKERLADTQLSRETYENKFVDAKGKILEFENKVSQLESQGQAREEAMHRKLEDSEKTLSATKGKLDHTSSDLSRVQTELALARDEVEAHVQAADKQRLSAAKALEEAAAERTALETGSQRKQNELCQQMQQRKREMEQQLETERAGYRLNISSCRAEKEQVLCRLQEVAREKEVQRQEFESKESEIKNAVKYAQIERDQLRDAYEDMLAALKTELDKEVNIHQAIRDEHCQAKAAWEKREQQLMEKQSTTEAEKREYLTKSENQTQETKQLKHQMKTLEIELQSKVQTLHEFASSCGKLKQELDTMESKLLETTRSRNLLEAELLEEKRAHKGKAAKLSFQIEELKAGHGKAVQEILAKLQDERKKHHEQGRELITQREDSLEQLQAAHLELVRLGEEKDATKQKLDSEKSKVRDLEGELEKARYEFADKQKAMLGEASKNHSKLQEDYEAERGFWKTKLDQAAREAMDLRSELYEKSQKHASDLMKQRKRARNREEEMDLEANNLREENRCLEKHIGKLNEIVAELEENLKHSEAKEKELAEERDKCADLRANCEEFATKEKSYKQYIEVLKADAQKEREELGNEVQMERKQREDMLESHLQETSQLMVHLQDLERTKEQEKNEEIQKLSDERRTKEESLSSEIEDFQTKLKQSTEHLEKMEKSLKSSRDEKEKGDEEVQNLKQEWASKCRDLEEKIAELEQERDGMAELTSTLDKMQQEREAMVKRAESAEEEHANLEQQFREEGLVNRRLATELRSLEAQRSQADRVIREQKQELQRLKNQPEHSVKTTTAERDQRNSENFRLKTEVERLPENNNEVSGKDTTSESDESRLKVEDLNTSTSSRLSQLSACESSNQLGRFGTSATNTSSRASVMRNGVRNRRQSAIYLRGKTPPEMRTTCSEAFFINDQFTMQTEDENGDEYNWDRLSELKRRNASCMPHLQTAYAVEMQLLKPDSNANEDAIKKGCSPTSAQSFTRKRKAAESFYDAGNVMTRSASAKAVNGSRTAKNLPSSKSENCITSGKRRKSPRLSEMVQMKLESLVCSKSSENLTSSFQKASQENLPPVSDEPMDNGAEESSLKRGAVSFNIMNEPRNVTGKPSLGRRRTITRSLASTRLFNNGAKEECKKVLEKSRKHGARGASKKPLRPKQLKK